MPSSDTQTNFTAESFLVSSTRDRPASARATRASRAPETDPNEVPDGTSQEVLDWAGDDADRQRRALDKENASDKPRTTLVEPLEKALAPAEQPEAEEPKAKKAAPRKTAAKKADGDK